MRLIDVEELKDDIDVLLERNEKLIDLWLAYAIDYTIDEQTVIEAEPVKRGRWIIEPGIGCKCTACGFDIGNDLDFMEYVHYCPHCGARMEEQEV